MMSKVKEGGSTAPCVGTPRTKSCLRRAPAIDDLMQIVERRTPPETYRVKITPRDLEGTKKSLDMKLAHSASIVEAMVSRFETSNTDKENVAANTGPQQQQLHGVDTAVRGVLREAREMINGERASTSNTFIQHTTDTDRLQRKHSSLEHKKRRSRSSDSSRDMSQRHAELENRIQRLAGPMLRDDASLASGSRPVSLHASMSSRTRSISPSDLGSKRSHTDQATRVLEQFHSNFAFYSGHEQSSYRPLGFKPESTVLDTQSLRGADGITSLYSSTSSSAQGQEGYKNRIRNGRMAVPSASELKNYNTASDSAPDMQRVEAAVFKMPQPLVENMIAKNPIVVASKDSDLTRTQSSSSFTQTESVANPICDGMVTKAEASAYVKELESTKIELDCAKAEIRRLETCVHSLGNDKDRKLKSAYADVLRAKTEAKEQADKLECYLQQSSDAQRLQHIEMQRKVEAAHAEVLRVRAEMKGLQDRVYLTSDYEEIKKQSEGIRMQLAKTSSDFQRALDENKRMELVMHETMETYTVLQNQRRTLAVKHACKRVHYTRMMAVLSHWQQETFPCTCKSAREGATHSVQVSNLVKELEHAKTQLEAYCARENNRSHCWNLHMESRIGHMATRGSRTRVTSAFRVWWSCAKSSANQNASDKKKMEMMEIWVKELTNALEEVKSKNVQMRTDRALLDQKLVNMDEELDVLRNQSERQSHDAELQSQVAEVQRCNYEKRLADADLEVHKLRVELEEIRERFLAQAAKISKAAVPTERPSEQVRHSIAANVQVAKELKEWCEDQQGRAQDRWDCELSHVDSLEQTVTVCEALVLEAMTHLRNVEDQGSTLGVNSSQTVTCHDAQQQTDMETSRTDQTEENVVGELESRVQELEVAQKALEKARDESARRVTELEEGAKDLQETKEALQKTIVQEQRNQEKLVYLLDDKGKYIQVLEKQLADSKKSVHSYRSRSRSRSRSSSRHASDDASGSCSEDDSLVSTTRRMSSFGRTSLRNLEHQNRADTYEQGTNTEEHEPSTALHEVETLRSLLQKEQSKWEIAQVGFTAQEKEVKIIQEQLEKYQEEAQRLKSELEGEKVRFEGQHDASKLKLQRLEGVVKERDLEVRRLEDLNSAADQEVRRLEELLISSSVRDEQLERAFSGISLQSTDLSHTRASPLVRPSHSVSKYVSPPRTEEDFIENEEKNGVYKRELFSTHEGGEMYASQATGKDAVAGDLYASTAVGREAGGRDLFKVVAEETPEAESGEQDGASQEQGQQAPVGNGWGEGEVDWDLVREWVSQEDVSSPLPPPTRLLQPVEKSDSNLKAGTVRNLVHHFQPQGGADAAQNSSDDPADVLDDVLDHLQLESSSWGHSAHESMDDSRAAGHTPAGFGHLMDPFVPSAVKPSPSTLLEELRPSRLSGRSRNLMNEWEEGWDNSPSTDESDLQRSGEGGDSPELAMTNAKRQPPALGPKGGLQKLMAESVFAQFMSPSKPGFGVQAKSPKDRNKIVPKIDHVHIPPVRHTAPQPERGPATSEQNTVSFHITPLSRPPLPSSLSAPRYVSAVVCSSPPPVSAYSPTVVPSPTRSPTMCHFKVVHHNVPLEDSRWNASDVEDNTHVDDTLSLSGTTLSLSLDDSSRDQSMNNAIQTPNRFSGYSVFA